MSYKILCDSCTDFTMETKKDSHFCMIPLSIQIGDDLIVDDETFNQKEFLQKIDAYPECAKSSCPSPESFLSHFEEADDIYIVTLSSRLSGSYNSAKLAIQMYQEEHEGTSKNLYAIDTLSASVGQTLIAFKIKELAEKGLPFAEVIAQTEEYRSTMGTKFVLESLETLRKNGRLTNLTATIANVLNIKPIMSSDGNGQIKKSSQSKGMKKAIKKMAECMADDAIEPEKRILGIAHCNNPERAEYTKKVILDTIPFKDVYITETAGISSLYASDGGIVVAY